MLLLGVGGGVSVASSNPKAIHREEEPVHLSPKIPLAMQDAHHNATETPFVRLAVPCILFTRPPTASNPSKPFPCKQSSDFCRPSRPLYVVSMTSSGIFPSLKSFSSRAISSILFALLINSWNLPLSFSVSFTIPDLSPSAASPFTPLPPTPSANLLGTSNAPPLLVFALMICFQIAKSQKLFVSKLYREDRVWGRGSGGALGESS